MLAPGAIVDPEDLRVPGERPGTPVVVIDDLGEQAHGHRFRARQGKSLLLLTVLTPDVTLQREVRDVLLHRLLQVSDIVHPNLLPTYGWAPLPLGEDGFDTLFVVRPDPGCPTLRQWLHEVWQAGHTLDPLNAVAIAVQVCEALAALHEHCAHGFVTVDNVFMYPTGGMPQALLSAAGEGVVVPFAPGFDAFARAGYLPMAGRELFESPHEPRVETDVLGAAALVLEILTGRPLEPGMPLSHFGLPPRLERVLQIASQANPEDRPKDILMFSRRLQAAVGLGEDPVEPSAVLEPVHHGEHADPRYPAVRAKPWRPPPPPPPPWAREAGPTPGSGAWNIGAPTPGSGAWNLAGPTPGSGAWNLAGPTPGSGAWNIGRPAPGTPGSGAWNLGRPPAPGMPSAGPPVHTPSGGWPIGPGAPPPPIHPSPPPGVAPGNDTARWSPPLNPRQPAADLARNFPVLDDDEPAPNTAMHQPPSSPRTEAKTKHLPGAPPPPGQAPPPLRFDEGPPSSAPGSLAPGSLAPGAFSGSSVSIMMPAPDGSVMASIGQGPRNYTIMRNGKAHGPYDRTQLERLVPMGKLRSVDTVIDATSGIQLLAVDIPGMRPLFEAKAREADLSVVRPLPTAPIAAAPAPAGRGGLWLVIGLLAAAMLLAVAVLALR